MTPLTTQEGQSEGFWVLVSAARPFPPPLLRVPSPSRQTENQALPSLLRGWVVGEIMILSCLLPLGRQVLENNQVRSGFSPCSLHIPSQDKFSQRSLCKAAPRMPTICSPGQCQGVSHGCPLWPGMQASGTRSSLCPATRPPTPAQCPWASVATSQTRETLPSRPGFCRGGRQSTECRRALKSGARLPVSGVATEHPETGPFRVKSRDFGAISVDKNPSSGHLLPICPLTYKTGHQCLLAGTHLAAYWHAVRDLHVFGALSKVL